MSTQVKIRQYRPDDVQPVYEAVMESHAELAPWMPWCHDNFSLKDAEEWVAGRPGAWDANEEWSFVIVDQDDRILGAAGMHRFNLYDGVAEAGYWVRSSVTGQGIATRAFRQMCDWAFEEKKMHRIEILVAVDNFASQRVAEKAGGQREGVLRERELLRGERHDIVLYSILNNK